MTDGPIHGQPGQGDANPNADKPCQGRTGARTGTDSLPTEHGQLSPPKGGQCPDGSSETMNDGTRYVCPECGAELVVLVRAKAVMCSKHERHALGRGAVAMTPAPSNTGGHG